MVPDLACPGLRTNQHATKALCVDVWPRCTITMQVRQGNGVCLVQGLLMMWDTAITMQHGVIWVQNHKWLTMSGAEVLVLIVFKRSDYWEKLVTSLRRRDR